MDTRFWLGPTPMMSIPGELRSRSAALLPSERRMVVESMTVTGCGVPKIARVLRVGVTVTSGSRTFWRVRSSPHSYSIVRPTKSVIFASRP